MYRMEVSQYGSNRRLVRSTLRYTLGGTGNLANAFILPLFVTYFFNNLGFVILSRILFVRLYPVSSLKSSLFPFIAAKRALVAEGAALGRFRAILLKGRNLKAFLRFSPTIMIEFGEKFSEILAILLFFADAMKVTLGNHLLKIRNLFATGRGFFIFPTE